MQESKREERKKLADEDAQIKIKKLEEQAYSLQRQVATQKQVVHILILITKLFTTCINSNLLSYKYFKINSFKIKLLSMIKNDCNFSTIIQ